VQVIAEWLLHEGGRPAPATPAVQGEHERELVGLMQVNLPPESVEPLLDYADLQAGFERSYDQVERLVRRLGLHVHRVPAKCVTQAELRTALGLPRGVGLGAYLSPNTSEPGADQPATTSRHTATDIGWAS